MRSFRAYCLENFFGVTIYPCFINLNCLPQDKFYELCSEMRGLAKESFNCIPEYQCLKEDYAQLKDKLLIIHRNSKGELDAFSSSVVLKSDSVQEIFHLGLFIVSPQERHHHLQFKLGISSIVAYLAYRPFRYRYWITNVSSVLCTIATVDRMYLGTYPGLKKNKPDLTHITIAKEFQDGVVDRCCISKNSIFDSEKFIFRKANESNCFYKKADDKQYHGLKEQYNNYYKSLLNLDEGDAILQVGYATHFRVLLAILVYMYKIHLPNQSHSVNKGVKNV